MSINYLLDSSVLIYLLKQDSVILQYVVDVAPANFYVSAVALGELYYGAEHSVHVERSLSQVDDLARRLTVLHTDLAVAKRYGRIKHEQRTKGLMLPDNDLWIAATAIQYGLTLAARDQHFNWIVGLSIEQW